MTILVKVEHLGTAGQPNIAIVTPTEVREISPGCYLEQYVWLDQPFIIKEVSS